MKYKVNKFFAIYEHKIHPISVVWTQPQDDMYGCMMTAVPGIVAIPGSDTFTTYEDAEFEILKRENQYNDSEL